MTLGSKHNVFEDVVVSESREQVVGIRDPYTRHGEELVRSRYGPELADHSFEWPQIPVTSEDFRDTEVIVSRIDGVVAGRAILDMAFYPIAELENLEVAPPLRGRGVGGAIVRHAVEIAARAGFLAIHAQTENENVTAQRLYSQHGFMPATRGKMLRVWRFLNLPALAQFLHDHPMALLDSRQVSGHEHVLRWFDTGSEDEIAVTIRGGSCQADSNGVGPAVTAIHLQSGSVKLTAALDSDPSVKPAGSFSTHITLANDSDSELVGGFRMGLNPGFRVASDYPGGERFSLAPASALERSVEVALSADFPMDTLGVMAYPSVPVTVDFLLGDHTLWLAAQTHVSQTNGG